jgi:hypothetical protein
MILICDSFKRRLGWKREAGEFDGIEQFNFYRGEFEDQDNRVPECIKPFMDEITAFAEVLRYCLGIMNIVDDVCSISPPQSIDG